MKRMIQALALITTAASLITTTHAGSVGAYFGKMDTDLMGEGKIVGGFLEFDVLPLTSLQFRAGYADAFKKIALGRINMSNLSDQDRRIAENLFTEINRTDRFQLDDFCIIPLEVGLVGRLSFLGFFGIYGGAGVGYYVIPAFDIIAEGGFSASENIDDLTGYWLLAGVEAGLPVVSVFAEVKYTRILKDDLEIEIEYFGHKGTLTADINLSGFMALIGARIKW